MLLREEQVHCVDKYRSPGTPAHPAFGCGMRGLVEIGPRGGNAIHSGRADASSRRLVETRRARLVVIQVLSSLWSSRVASVLGESLGGVLRLRPSDASTHASVGRAPTTCWFCSRCVNSSCPSPAPLVSHGALRRLARQRISGVDFARRIGLDAAALRHVDAAKKHWNK